MNDEPTVVAAAEPATGRAWANKWAVGRAMKIEELAALIHDVDANHDPSPSALATALVDRGISLRPNSFP
ncbi:MAG: hypothetical protein K0U84_12575 [Actinomycetia bacterium]|nr:hypothetical protein [Actinomycetes bacterium]